MSSGMREKRIRITEDYLYIPVWAGQEEKLLEVYAEENGMSGKVMELLVPVQKPGECHSFDYSARFTVKQFADKTLTLKGELPEAFWNGVKNAAFQKQMPLVRPSVHFTAERGWINDPNGLICADGVYHLYFQYNPVNTSWQNMSWGHAVSRDLLHWEEQESVMLPDEYGMIFSGCALANDREKFGLPKEAILFFYTAAAGDTVWSRGGTFTQRMAYSLDGGQTLRKWGKPILETVCKENRDPKIFWHEESGRYVMTLWLEKNDFALFCSEDLEAWEMTERFTLPDAWECPDLVRLSDENGRQKWMFWSADGFYYWGKFDGRHFETDGVQHKAYWNNVPYAAQIYSGTGERTVAVLWLRISFADRLYTGVMGLPRELGYTELDGETLLVQRPVREFLERLEYREAGEKEAGTELVLSGNAGDVWWFEAETASEDGSPLLLELNGTVFCYRPDSGEIIFGENRGRLPCGQKQFAFLIDDKLIEIWAGYAIMSAGFPSYGAAEAGSEMPSVRLPEQSGCRWKLWQIGK